MQARCVALGVVAYILVGAVPTSAAAQAVPLLPLLPPLPVPVAQSVAVVPPPDEPSAPGPTGNVTLSADGRTVMTRPVGSTNDLALTAATLAGLGQNVTVSYSGDDYYEPSDPVPVTVPGDGTVTITARPRDFAAPAIEILSPGDGVRYAVGESVPAIYSCKDPGDRSAVTRCEGPVPAGVAIDTATAGSYPFAVVGTDARGNTDTKTITFEVGGSATVPAISPAAGGDGGDASRPSAQPITGIPPVRTAVAPRSGPPVGSSGAARGRSRSARPGARPGVPAERTTGSGNEDAAHPVRQQLAPYDPRSNPAQTVGILVAAFTLLRLGRGGGGLALAGGGGGVGRSASRRRSKRRRRSATSGGDDRDSAPEASFDYEGVEVEQLGGGVAAFAIGDRSRTWGWPGTRTIDAIGAALPARLARRSPLLARVTADGTYLRAILGSASLLGLLVGVALGCAALLDVGGEAIPPAATLTIAIATLGVLDATAGFVAVLIFTTGVLALGGIDSNAHLRLMLGLGALWFVVPVLAGAVRPLRREPTRRLEESWDRAADFVIASLIGAWAVQKIVLALPGLAGEELPLTPYADTAAYCVLAALVVRLGLETLAAHLYPRRLSIAEPGDLPEPGAMLLLGATALRTVIFVFFAYIVVGHSWQLWVGAALFVIPQVLAVYEEHVPNSPGLFRALPTGVLELVLMLLVGTAVGALLISTMDENAKTFIATSFVLLSLPGFLLSLLQLFGRDGDEPTIGWGKRIAGVGLLVLGVLLALGLLL